MIARRREIDLENIFTYELASVPLSLAKLDGSLNKTAESNILQELERHGSNYPSLPSEEKLTSWIIDGMALLQMFGHGKAATFGELASKIFDIVRHLFNTSSVLRVDIVFDRYDTEHSIKEMERQRRQNVSGYEVQIYSSSVPVPKLWDKFMSSNTNKPELAKFLCEHWSSQYVACVPSGKMFVLSGDFVDREKAVIMRDGSCEFCEPLSCNHEEADTRLILHANDAKQISERIVIWSPDTDVGVLGIQHYKNIKRELWLCTGVKDKSRFVPLHEIAINMGTKRCDILPICHPLSGCDTTSAFSRLGKLKLWNEVSESVKTYKKLCDLGENIEITPESLATVEKLLIKLYGSNVNTINKARYVLFCQKQATGESLPPTDDALKFHVMRVNYQLFIWKKALVATPTIPPPTGNGWHLEDDILVPTLIEREPAPNTLVEFTTCGCQKGCGRNCKCQKEDLP